MPRTTNCWKRPPKNGQAAFGSPCCHYWRKRATNFGILETDCEKSKSKIKLTVPVLKTQKEERVIGILYKLTITRTRQKKLQFNWGFNDILWIYFAFSVNMGSISTKNGSHHCCSWLVLFFAAKVPNLRIKTQIWEFILKQQ